MLRAAICQTLLHQNVLRGNSSKFDDVNLSRCTVHGIFDKFVILAQCKYERSS